ncbi:BTAD domain-containing putative transcriptional regulator [Streptomyces sp. SP2-10]|uniref:BTAD domain-containing putative transcriptional regulator n=1 Tax=Streptomyces sp. SP2-10 TaxID=2873385 RepID=UPI0022288297|nr:BTAD domain-containing putative transcriptional regulator [Streptomyces sp. SP2-10]
MLGPLEVVSGDRVIDLGGGKQRATLGFLLLRPNQAVPISRLLTALWSVGEAPATARKILQNAVWGLRRKLSSDDPAAGAALRTQSPGYTLEVDPEHIDLYRFRRMVEEGRALLTAGRLDEASRRLREALWLWRGAVLSDLVEEGVHWPELTTLQNSRTDVLEDYFEAELECGRHYSVLSEIEAVVECEPLRERSCGQLMRAMYRCGRQADALGVYSRLRVALVEELGLEPGRELQLLQQAILTHDPALELAPHASPVILSGPAPAAAVPATTMATALRAPRAAGTGDQRNRTAATDPDRWPSPRPERAPAPAPVPQEVSALLLRVGVHAGADRPDDTDALFDRMDGSIRQEIESRGGTVVAAMGTDTLGVFPARPGTVDHAERAVCAATALRAACAQAGAAPGDVVIKAAIVTGEALMRHRTEEDIALSPSAGGALLHACQAMLPLVPDGEIQVCPTTRAATEPGCTYTLLPGDPPRWQLRHTVPDAGPAGRTVPGAKAGHEGELELLHSLLEHSTRWHRQHQVFLLGGSDQVRAHLLAEFGRIAGQDPYDALVLSWSGASARHGGRFALHRAVLAAYCGIPAQDPPAAARGRLEATLRRFGADPGRAARLAARLGPFIDPPARSENGFRTGEWLEGWRQFVELASRERPLVLITDGLHQADDATCDFLESLADLARRLPVLVVAGAESASLSRRARLVVDRHFTTVIRMDARTGPAVDRLSDGIDLLRLPQLAGATTATAAAQELCGTGTPCAPAAAVGPDVVRRLNVA